MSRLFIESAGAIGVRVTAEQSADFLRFLDHLVDWNKAINLTSITEPKDIIIKHFVDSLTVLPCIAIREGSAVLDVGAGAGFPGMPLKIMRRDLAITFVEPSAKKTSFLQFIIGLFRFSDVSVFQGPLRAFAHLSSHREAFDLAVTRALRPEPLLRDLATTMRISGKLVLYRSSSMAPAGALRGFNLCLENEYHIDLPHNYGKRTLSVLGRV